jgi:hypothetical protein
MLRAIRVLVVAAVIAVSLAFGGSTASAGTTKVSTPNVHPVGFTWE